MPDERALAAHAKREQGTVYRLLSDDPPPPTPKPAATKAPAKPKPKAPAAPKLPADIAAKLQQAAAKPRAAVVREIGGVRIERGVPIPKKTGNRTGRTKYPFLLAMEVDDSAEIPRDLRRKVENAARKLALRTGRRYSFRTVTDGGERVHRIWRTA